MGNNRQAMWRLQGKLNKEQLRNPEGVGFRKGPIYSTLQLPSTVFQSIDNLKMFVSHSFSILSPLISKIERKCYR